MFKLESYITPILLNYVAKYVKDLRDEDAQVSLWEGEVTFQNLDLRLDVLQEELNLPIELLSGHIHELSIQVPWTKLMSEPVRIVINTIEFVAKLPDEESKKSRATLFRDQRRKLKGSRAELVEPAPPQAGATNSNTVNKIINNINVQCHNIILKYVEDDIVVSMNVQYLSFTPANEKWQNGMVDVHPVNVCMRKLLQISDLTICLDQRNPAGRIDVCQEPVLYRCTLECRVLRKHNINTMSTTSTTRIGVLTKSLDINVSSLQLPMVMRLIKMLLDLKPADMDEDIFTIDEPTIAPSASQHQNREERNTVFQWAWNLLPRLTDTGGSLDSGDVIGHAFDVGVYAEQLNFMLKNSEYFIDQAMGSIKRIKYTPILRISLGGIYYERSQLKEVDWANVRAGLSSIYMEPLGPYRSDDPIDRSLLNTKEYQNERAYIDKSLFDEYYTFADRAWCSNNYDDYFSRITDEYMLFRSPVMAFDIVEYRSSRTMPKQAAEVAASSVTNELKDFGLRVKYRLLSAGITFHFSQSFLQVKNVISDLVCSLNYQGIHADSNNDNEPTVVTTHQEYANEFMTYKDFEYLIGFMPTCNYKIELRDMNVQFYPLTNQASHESLSMLPYLRLRVPLATGSVCGPANPERIVQLITHLQDKPREIVDSCYLTYEFDVKDLTFTALNTSPEQHNAKLINIPRMTFQYNRLLMPEKWRTNVAALESAVITAEIINMEFSKREFLIAQRIILMCISYKPNELAALATAIAETSPSADVIRLQTLISKLRLGYRKYHTHHAMLASVRNINADVHHSVMNVRNVVFSTNKGVTNKWMELQLQFPIPESAAQVDPPPSTVVCLWLESFRLTLDVYLLQFLKSFVQSIECTETETDTDQDAPSERQNSFSSLSVTSAAAFKMSINELQGRRFSRPSRKISIPEETVHASSDRDEKHAITFVVNPVATQAPETAKRDYVALVERLSTVVIFVESAQSRIDVCELMRRKKSEHITMEYTSIQLPRVKIKSNFSSVVSRGNIRLLVNPAIKSDQPFNWILEFNDFIIRYRKGSQTETLMAPVRTTVTLVISQKKLVVPESNDSKQSTDETESQPFSSISSVADLKKVDWANENAETESDKVVTWCVNVHIDMSAICFYGHRLKLLHEHFGILCTMYTSFRMSSYMLNCSKTADNTRLEIYTGSAQNQPLIKEFLELEPATHSPKRNKADKNEETFIFFGQWTIPRISLEMESFGNGKHRRVTLNFEDLLFNVDRHDSFNKVTAKVETLDLNYFTAKSPNEWTQMDSFQINTLGDSSNLPLLNVVITTVSLRDFYQKIGASDLFHKERSITELLIDVQPIEMVLDLDQLTEFCIPLCELLDYVRKNNPYQGSNASRPSQYKDTIKTVQQMPIVHLNSKGIFIYAPLETEKQCCSVLVLQIESIRLTPNLENPLVRQLIRPDIYSKAAELNMLHTPGSLVEDRQYELSVRKISLSSGNWQQTQQHRMAETRANEYDNPAFEWNNQLGSDALLKWDIFKDFDFITVFAPAISYERFLVCGQSIEYNCVSDFVASLNSPQINLISCFIVRVQRLQGILEESCLKDLRSVSTSRANSSVLIPMERKKLHSIMSPPRTNFQTPETKSSETFVGSCQSDSGIYIAKGVSIISSITNSIIPRTSELIVSRRFYPRSISFVAGIFALRLYDAVELEQQLILRPLMLVTISQPSFMTTQNLRKSVTQGSLFDFTVHVPGAQSPPTSISDECFSESVIFTMPGTLGSSGIPSPLLTFKLNRDRHQQKEMDLELLKPLVMRLCESTVRQLISDVVRINTVLHESPCFALRSERPVVHTTPLRQLKLTCFNRDRVNLRCDSLTIKFYDHERTYQFNAILRDFNGNLKFNLRPHKAAVKATLGAFFIQAGDKILLHPLLMRLSADLLSEPWCDQLLICATLKLNVLHVDAGVFTMLHLRKARAGFDRTMEHARLEWSGFLQQRPSLGMPEEVSPELLALYTPSKAEIQRAKLTQKPKVEFYQDDLRAGAFQFVYLNSDNMLPMPYQVQIIKKNYGIICWRYPQPRQMKHIHIYPVPMPVDNPIHIRCRMEYFSETHETFLYYCDFELSEQTSKHINPPERQISANIWRVVIMQSLVSVDGTCFEPDSDEDLQSIDSCRVVHDFKGNVDNDFVLHPKVLVGCMRIDTTFQAELVPKLQFLLACQDIELNLLNQPDAYDVLPPELDSYKLKSTTQISQNFLTLHVSNLQLHTEMYKPTDYSVELNFRSRIKCLDSGFLNMIDVMEPMSFQSYVRYVGCLRKMQANFVLDKLRFNCSACVIQTLYSAKQHWQEVLQQREELHTLMPKCVVVNRLQLPITFGQSGTSERIQLAPQQLRLYHFCSDFHTQELTFYVENPETQQLEASSSVHIAFKFEEEQRVHQLRIGQRCITIKQAKLSATQVYILVKGQIELLSMVPYELLAEFRVEDEPDKEALEHVLAAKGRASFCHQVMRQTNINMRLKLSAGQAKGRTGDIPLKTNNSLPWLVKVPTQSAQQFISLWVRILREDIALTGVQDDFQPQRILVSIWPIFEICNLLNCALQATESSTERPLAIDAAGGRLALSTATTHATEHRVKFSFPCALGDASQSEYTFMLKTMDWHKFFHYDEQAWSIDQALHKLSKKSTTKWPLDDDEELRVERCSKVQNMCDVQYRVGATREFSCTQGLDIAAWGMFINATELDIAIGLAKGNTRVSLKANCLEMVPALNQLFTIDVPFGSSWLSSSPICLEDVSPGSNVRHLQLRPNSHIDLVVLRNEEVVRMLLEFRLEDGRRVFKLRSKFVLTNFTDVPLQALPLTMDHKESSNREEVTKLDFIRRLRTLNCVEPLQQPIGISTNVFIDLKARKSKHSSDTAFVYFICFTVLGSQDISIPIPLTLPFTRRCFSLQHGSESIALIVTLIERQNVYYLSVFKDTAPAIILSNNTNVKFVVAQTSASGNSNVSCTSPELASKHFDWNQLVAPSSKCYYTPPQMYANFPDVDFTVCNLSLAVYNEPGASGKRKYSWSKPIRTDKSWKKFLHVPSHGDVKVVVCDKHRVIRVNIYYIAQQLEFSVKDLRSRFNEAPTSQTPRDSEIEKLPLREADSEAALISVDCAHFKEECDPKMQLQLRLLIKSFVFSLQTAHAERDYLKTEVCNMYADDLMLVYDEIDDDDQRSLRLLMPNLQVDNQLYSSGKYDFPVLLCAQQLYKRTACLPLVYDLNAVYERQAAQTQPQTLLSFVFYQDELALQSVHCRFQPFRVYIEDAYLNRLLDTLVECEPSNCTYTPRVQSSRMQLALGQTLLPDLVVTQALYISEPLRLNSFCVEPLSLLLSVHTSSRLYIALDHSPLSFSRYERQQLLTVPLRFGQSLGLHYLSGAIFGAGWVVGSLEILGSPSGLARSLSTGLRDFISMPVEGLFRGPWGFLVGVTQGSASLLRNVTAGTVNSVTKLAGSVARNLDRLTLDSEHIELTEARRRARPQGFADGLTQGLTGLGISLLGAVGGLAHHTLEARSSVGVIAGLTKGIVGALTKPLSGAAEMLALTGQGVLHTVGFNTMPQQVEPSVTRNVALHFSSYRIWRFLPAQLSTDQILFFQEISLKGTEQLRPALLFLTSTVLAIMELECDVLTFVSPVAKVEVVPDREDPSKLYLSLKTEQSNEQGQLNYINERIISFLHASRSQVMTSSNSLSDLLQLPDRDQDERVQRQSQCTLYIKANIGEHLVNYIKVIDQMCPN